ncbi:hypothetical protein GOBAR_AA06577 [Gossypium barbadense]|uniref:Uncharacterized protein n=1 Tax=Gossypium barbadense TaxID=3634 RepID=A0A2P5YEH9_GOSBA|nr:hypothetical protein GOBAR_AA06577 [Gossypium barbadense]
MAQNDGNPRTYIQTWAVAMHNSPTHPLEFLDKPKLLGLSPSFMQCTAPSQNVVTQEPLLNTKLPLDGAVMGEERECAGSREQRRKKMINNSG